MIFRAGSALALCCACLAPAAPADPWPRWPVPDGARQTAEHLHARGFHNVPAAPFDGSAVPRLSVEGTALTRGWSAPLTDATTLPVLGEALRTALIASGFQILLDCQTAACGGFDFRHHVTVLPPPEMFFDMSDFYALTATRQGETGLQAVFLLLSRSGGHASWQATLISPTEDLPAVQIPLAAEPRQEPAPELAARQAQSQSQAQPQSLSEKLAGSGRVVLNGVTFRPGATSIDDLPPMLQELADHLRQNPEVQVILVGHADSIGSDAANMRLSKLRAQSVRSLMINRLGVRPTQIRADGAGVLLPRASNATPEGRALNRRIEVVEVVRSDR